MAAAGLADGGVVSVAGVDGGVIGQGQEFGCDASQQVDERLRAYGRHLPLRTAVILGGVVLANQEADSAVGVAGGIQNVQF